MSSWNRPTLGGFATAALAVFFSAGSARGGAILFSDLGSGAPVYNCCAGVFISGSTSLSHLGSNSNYFAFAPSSTAMLEQIDVAFIYFSGTNSVQFTLNSDSAGSPGAALQTWILTNLPVFLTCCTLQTVTPTSPILLTLGTQYWVGASAIAADTEAGFAFNNTGATGPRASSTNGGPFVVSTTTLGAFDLLGATVPVPEPGTFVLVTAGLALALLRRCSDPSAKS